MIRSKYLGTHFDNGWVVTCVEIAGRYGKRKKAKGNTYRFVLTRKTNDNKCVKSLTLSHNTLLKVVRGKTSVEEVELRKTMISQKVNNASSYQFLKNK